MRKINKQQANDGTSEAGRSISRGLAQALQAFRGAKPLTQSPLVTVREAEVPEPRVYRADDVRRVRAEVLGVSQAVFANMVGASAELVRSWEQGRREPSTMARRLLDVAAGDPERFIITVTSKRGKTVVTGHKAAQQKSANRAGGARSRKSTPRRAKVR